MSQLRAAIERMRVAGESGFPKSPGTQPEIQKQLHRFDEGVGTPEASEELVPFLRRARTAGPQRLRRHDLNRVLRGVWHDESFDDFGVDAVRRAELEAKRSTDQAMIEGYLTFFPYDRPSMIPLASAAQRAADRWPWAWQRRSARWNLFDPSRGPSMVGLDIAKATTGEPENLLSEVGIGRNIATTRFGRRSFIAACGEIKGLEGEQATLAQKRLLRLFDNKDQAGDLPALVQALLEPWISAKPDQEHRKALSEFLLHQVGDPRMAATRWKNILESIAKTSSPERARAIVNVLKRWLTDVAMREFFRAIAKTTDRPDQWEQRSKFWLAYLDAGLVSDAWPALGQRACRQIEDIIRQGGERPDYGVMRGGPQSSSSIIMQIGDLRIAEWSDNGSCRFWSDSDSKAPKLYSKFYDGNALRTTAGRADFEYESHVPASPGWEGKFAGVIHRRSGIPHPKFGRGRGRSWNDKW